MHRTSHGCEDLPVLRDRQGRGADRFHTHHHDQLMPMNRRVILHIILHAAVIAGLAYHRHPDSRNSSPPTNSRRAAGELTATIPSNSVSHIAVRGIHALDRHQQRARAKHERRTHVGDLRRRPGIHHAGHLLDRASAVIPSGRPPGTHRTWTDNPYRREAATRTP